MGEKYILADDLEHRFQEQVAKIRMSADMSARELSASVGKSNSFFTQIENHSFLPSMRMLFVLCEHLQIQPRDFFDFDNPAPLEIQEIINGLYKLNDQERAHILETIRLFLNKHE